MEPSGLAKGTLRARHCYTRTGDCSVARNNVLLRGQLSVLTLKARKDPGHSNTNAGSRLQLYTHAPYVYGFQ